MGVVGQQCCVGLHGAKSLTSFCLVRRCFHSLSVNSLQWRIRGKREGNGSHFCSGPNDPKRSGRAEKWGLGTRQDQFQTLRYNSQLQGWKTLCESFCTSLIAGSRRAFLSVDGFFSYWESSDWDCMKCIRCERLFLEKPFYLFVFRHLKITLDSEQPMLKAKWIIPSVWGGIKSFEHFQRGEYFSDCAFDLFVSWFRLLSPGWIKTRLYSVISKYFFLHAHIINNSRVFFIFNYIVLFSNSLWKFQFFVRNNFLYANFPFHSLWSRERQLPAVTSKQLTLPVYNCWRWIFLRRAKQIPLSVDFCIFWWLAKFNLLCCLIIGVYVYALGISIPLSLLMFLGWSLMWITLQSYESTSESLGRQTWPRRVQKRGLWFEFVKALYPYRAP